MIAKVYSCAVHGIDGYSVEVEVDLARGMPAFDIVGLPDAAVKESKERVRAAVKNSGFEFPLGRVTVNLAPADIKKEGPIFDLPIAIGLLGASGQVSREAVSEFTVIGELSLDGSVRPVTGVLPMAIAAREAKLKGMIVPDENAQEAALITGLNVFPVKSLQEAVGFLNGKLSIEPVDVDMERLMAIEEELREDYADVKGQEAAKRALEVAAAGSHNLLMIGPPGSGKTMLARRLPSVLPPLSLDDEAIEVTKLYSIAGLLPHKTSLVTTRPFRSPHHTVSGVAIIGGGRIPKPGEISLAHHGVLFLDELPEFPRDVLEVLRQPLEDGKVTISRALTSLTYPARFLLLAAMNPCFCGRTFGECTCNPHAVQRYLAKISGPLLDRFDIHIEVPRLKLEELTEPKDVESSAAIRGRVQMVRKIQKERFKSSGIYCNGQMLPRQIKEFCSIKKDAKELLKQAVQKLGLSARAYDRILKVARTIADLAGEELIGTMHIAEAIQYRSLDRKMWG